MYDPRMMPNPYDPQVMAAQGTTNAPAANPYATLVAPVGQPGATQQAAKPAPTTEQQLGQAAQQFGTQFAKSQAKPKDDDPFQTMFHGSSPMGRIQVTGRPTMTTMSDRRAKTNVRPAKSALRAFLDAIAEREE